MGLHGERSRAVLIVGSDWNRVDAFSMPSGRLITEREPTSYARGEERPEHYLDYFHGNLIVSPSGQQIVDDGWIWHPVGAPLRWSVADWIGGAVWAAEKPEFLLQRDYLWDTPMCWIGDDKIAIWGVGQDSDAVVPGLQILDLRTRAAPQIFAGVPRSEIWSNGVLIFSKTDIGLSVWDPRTGERIAELVGLHPLGYNPHMDEFLVRAASKPERIRLRVG